MRFQTSTVLILFIALSLSVSATADTSLCEAEVPFMALTEGPMAHWFAYYDKFQFDPSDRYVLAMEVGFEDRAPRADDAIVLGMIDLQDGNKWIPFAETTAWCWQQGAMLQWLPGSSEEVIYNIRTESDYASVIHNVFTGEKRQLPRPVYAVNPDGKSAVGLNFTRLGDTRPGYGYNGFEDPLHEELHPDSEGIYHLDLTTGESRTIINLNQIALGYGNETTALGKHWFNHLLYNTDGSRFIFLHRWHKENRKGRFTQGFTAAPDGSDIFCFNDNGMVSHFIWRDEKEILAWSTEKETGNKFHRYFDQSDRVEVVAPEVLIQDGHCTWSPCGNWILTDTYPDKERKQTLLLYRPADGKRVDLGRFFQERATEEQLRCDLHPSWNRAGTQICIDSLCSGQRQVYLLDVGAVIRN
ncbi:MAG: hypothetical protein GX130_04515 [Candidatus Hydrogenedens sp.]|jgi:hypothetical protein|nr:hypothetical protein [Candidatus Hydrogenedens sp.]